MRDFMDGDVREHEHMQSGTIRPLPVLHHPRSFRNNLVPALQCRPLIGMDVHKATISISIAENGGSGPVRFIGVIPNTLEAVHKMAKQLARHGEIAFAAKRAVADTVFIVS